MNKLFIPIAIILVGVLIAGVIAYVNFSNSTNQEEAEDESLSAQEAGEKLVDFVNNDLLQGQTTASLIEILDENGLYKVKFEVDGEEVEWGITKDGKLILPQIIDLAEFESTAQPSGGSETIIGGFSVSTDEVCTEDGKPLVYFFGSEGCPHCVWEHPIVEEVMAKFEGYISFHNNMDSDADMDIFSKYSTGGIPAIVLGCKYYRVGSGENAGKEQESEDLTNLVCQLTNNQPAEVCVQ